MKIGKSLSCLEFRGSRNEMHQNMICRNDLCITFQIRNLGCYNLVHFRQVQQMEWRGQEDVEPFQHAKDKGLAQAPSSRLYILILGFLFLCP